jgi:tetratricopeptide (TPR) repeat protein
MEHASICAHSNESRLAEAFYKSALDLSGGKSATATEALASFYLSQNKYAEAESLYRRALAIRKENEQSTESYRLQLAQDLGSLGASLLGQGKTEEAEQVLQDTASRAKSISEAASSERLIVDIFVDAHRLMIPSLGHLAVIYDRQGKKKEAGEYYKSILKSLQFNYADEFVLYPGALDAIAAGGYFFVALNDDITASQFFNLVVSSPYQDKAISPEALFKVYDAYVALLRRQGNETEATLVIKNAGKLRKYLKDPLP